MGRGGVPVTASAQYEVDLGAQREKGAGKVQPEEQRDDRSNRSVEHLVAGEGCHVRGEDVLGDFPQNGRHQGARPDLANLAPYRRAEEVEGHEEDEVEKDPQSQRAEREDLRLPLPRQRGVVNESPHQEWAQTGDSDRERDEQQQDQGQQNSKEPPTPEGAHARSPVDPVQDLLKDVEGGGRAPHQEQRPEEAEAPPSANNLVERAGKVGRTEREQPQHLGGEARVGPSHAEKEAQDGGDQEKHGEKGEERVVGEARDQDRNMVLTILVPEFGEKFPQRMDHGAGMLADAARSPQTFRMFPQRKTSPAGALAGEPMLYCGLRPF